MFMSSHVLQNTQRNIVKERNVLHSTQVIGLNYVSKSYGLLKIPSIQQSESTLQKRCV